MVTMKKWISDDTKLGYECMLGRKSHINLIGKVILFPLILSMLLGNCVLDFLFLKENAQ